MSNGNYRFVGEDGSLGYRAGKIYYLYIEEKITEKGEFVVVTHPVYCPYSSWAKFYQNWEADRHLAAAERGNRSREEANKSETAWLNDSTESNQ